MPPYSRLTAWSSAASQKFVYSRVTLALPFKPVHVRLTLYSLAPKNSMSGRADARHVAGIGRIRRRGEQRHPSRVRVGERIHVLVRTLDRSDRAPQLID